VYKLKIDLKGFILEILPIAISIPRGTERIATTMNSFKEIKPPFNINPVTSIRLVDI
jgi:hypothetical protein